MPLLQRTDQYVTGSPFLYNMHLILSSMTSNDTAGCQLLPARVPTYHILYVSRVGTHTYVRHSSWIVINHYGLIARTLCYVFVAARRRYYCYYNWLFFSFFYSLPFARQHWHFKDVPKSGDPVVQKRVALKARSTRSRNRRAIPQYITSQRRTQQNNITKHFWPHAILAIITIVSDIVVQVPSCFFFILQNHCETFFDTFVRCSLSGMIGNPIIL